MPREDAASTASNEGKKRESSKTNKCCFRQLVFLFFTSLTAHTDRRGERDALSAVSNVLLSLLADLVSHVELVNACRACLSPSLCVGRRQRVHQQEFHSVLMYVCLVSCLTPVTGSNRKEKHVHPYSPMPAVQ